MPAVTRVGDTGDGHCPLDHESRRGTQEKDYTTTFVDGASSVLTNDMVSCIVSTEGDSNCGHPTHAKEGSPTVFFENQPAHRIGDMGENYGPYNVSVGSPNVFIND